MTTMMTVMTPPPLGQSFCPLLILLPWRCEEPHVSLDSGAGWLLSTLPFRAGCCCCWQSGNIIIHRVHLVPCAHLCITQTVAFRPTQTTSSAGLPLSQTPALQLLCVRSQLRGSGGSGGNNEKEPRNGATLLPHLYPFPPLTTSSPGSSLASFLASLPTRAREGFTLLLSGFSLAVLQGRTRRKGKRGLWIAVQNGGKMKRARDQRVHSPPCFEQQGC